MKEEKKNKKGVMGYAFAIIVVMAVVFLSQQPQFKSLGSNANPYVAKMGNWLSANVYPRLDREVATRGGEITKEITEQKDSAVKNIWQNFKKYFSEKVLKFSGTQVE